VSWNSKNECSGPYNSVDFLVPMFHFFGGEVFWSKYLCVYRNYLSSVLIQEIFLTLDHDDLSQRAKVRISVLRKKALLLLQLSQPSMPTQNFWSCLNLWYKWLFTLNIIIYCFATLAGCSNFSSPYMQAWIWCTLSKKWRQAVYCSVVFSSYRAGMSLLHLNTSYEKLQDLVYMYKILIFQDLVYIRFWLHISLLMRKYSLSQILDEMPVFYNLNAVEKREVLVVILQIIRNLDDATLIKAWQQSIARTRLFFKLLEECITHFEVSTIIFWVFMMLKVSLSIA